MKTVVLQEEKLSDKENAIAYFSEIYGLCHVPSNLDALYDLLTEVSEDILLTVTECDVMSVARKKPVVKVLQVVLDAIENNPHLRVSYSE